MLPGRTTGKVIFNVDEVFRMMTDGRQGQVRHRALPPVHSLGGDGDSARSILRALPDAEQVKFLQTIVDTVADPIIAHRPDGQVVFFSPSACKLFGYTPAEMDLMAPYGWIGSKHKRLAAGRIERILHDGHLEFESSVGRKDGGVIPTAVRAQRVDTVVGPLIIAVFRDASESARA